MPRMNQRNRKKMYAIIAARDGERCRVCGRAGDRDSLVVDCVDNSGDHTDPANLQLLCRSDNTRKNPRGKGKFSKGSTSQSIEDYEVRRVHSAEMQKNLQSEPTFRHWLFGEIQKHSVLSLTDVLNTGAKAAHCSQVTLKRYLAKECSRLGMYEIVKDEEGVASIRLKPTGKRGAPHDLEAEDPHRIKRDLLTGPSEPL